MFFFLFHWPLHYHNARNTCQHTFLELNSAEANIRILVIGEVLGGKLFALYQYSKYTTEYMRMNYDNDID